jgi:hypothetical protein
MFRKSIITFTLVLLVICGIASAYPTAMAMASAPTNGGNAVTDTNTIVSTWQSAGYSADGLITSSATKSAVLNYWKNDYNLVYYNNIGFGDTPSYNGAPAYGIVENDAEITSSDISNLNPSDGIIYSRIFINSCNSFENPLHDAFLSKNVYMFIGGVVLLPAYTSEDTATDFWYYYTISGQSAATALSNAENNHGTQGMFGLYGS